MNRADCNDIETCKIMKLNTQTDIKGKGNILQWWAAIPSGHCGYCVSLSKNRMKTNCYHLGKPMTIMMNEHFFLFGLPSQKSLLKALSLPLSRSRFSPLIPSLTMWSTMLNRSIGLICIGQTLRKWPCVFTAPLYVIWSTEAPDLVID